MFNKYKSHVINFKATVNISQLYLEFIVCYFYLKTKLKPDRKESALNSATAQYTCLDHVLIRERGTQEGN